VVLQMENCATHLRQLLRRFLITISAAVFLCVAHIVVADEIGVKAVQLQLKPSRCVALHQGQVCYQKILLTWSANQLGNYCLYQEHNELPIYCWKNVMGGQYQYDFASDTSAQLLLLNLQTKTVVATAALEVAWVYKANTRRKTHWRLF
jgi:hypothetical protein